MANKFLSYDGLLYFWQRLKSYFVKQEPGKGLSSSDFTQQEKQKLAGLSNYELPAASAEALGGVKVGSGLRVAEDGTLSATGGEASPVNWSDVQGRPDAYPPQAHTHTASEITDLTEQMLPSSRVQLTGAYTGETDLQTAMDEIIPVVAENQQGVQGLMESLEIIAERGYQTAEDVQKAIARADHLKRRIVTELPSAAEADASTIYMVPIPSAAGQNKYTEWMALEGAWEPIGDSSVDLSDYVRAEDLQLVSNGEIDSITAE